MKIINAENNLRLWSGFWDVTLNQFCIFLLKLLLKNKGY